MSHTNSTTNYSLPQFITTDKPAWLTDINGAFSDIDGQMKTNADAASNAQGDATQALTDAGNADTKATNAKTAADGALASIADEFQTTSTYAKGDYVIYNSLLYICNTAVSTPGAWTGATNWSRATVEDMADALKTQIINVDDKIPSFTVSKQSTSKSVTSQSTTQGSSTIIYSTTLLKGTYVIVNRFTFDTVNTTGSLKCKSGTGANNIDVITAQSEIGGHSGGYTEIDQISILTVGAGGTNYFCNALQTTGQTITIEVECTILKIA